MPLYGTGHSHGLTFSTASQAITANTVTYLTGSGILIPSSGLVVGQLYRWHIGISKTAAGTATPIFTFRTGTNRTTGDATVLTVTSNAQTATAAGAVFLVVLQVLVVSASVGIVVGSINNGTSAFGAGGSAASAGYANNADAGKYMGLAVNSGVSAAWTVNSVMGELA